MPDRVKPTPDSDGKSTQEHTIDKIYTILSGDISGRPGLIQLVNKLVEDMYDKQCGAQVEIQRIKARMTYAKAWIAGAAATGGVLAWVLERLFSK